MPRRCAPPPPWMRTPCWSLPIPRRLIQAASQSRLLAPGVESDARVCGEGDDAGLAGPVFGRRADASRFRGRFSARGNTPRRSVGVRFPEHSCPPGGQTFWLLRSYPPGRSWGPCSGLRSVIPPTTSCQTFRPETKGDFCEGVAPFAPVSLLSGSTAFIGAEGVPGPGQALALPRR